MTRQDKIDFERRRDKFSTMIKTPMDLAEGRIIYDELARKAESLRRRYENACSYEWACTEAYETASERKREKLIKEVVSLGLFAFIQSDPRGALLYVDNKAIAPHNNYSALCVYKG